MKKEVERLYEAMFLVDPAIAASDWDGIIATIKNILEKNQGRVISIRKWDERKLAYEINGKTRGTYILCYFTAEGRRIAYIERDIRLSERIMRALILRADHLSPEDIEKLQTAKQPEADTSPAETKPPNNEDTQQEVSQITASEQQAEKTEQ